MSEAKNPEEPIPKKRRRATTPQGRENQLIALAYDVVETQMIDGNASAMVLTHWLKLGTTKAKLEEEKLRKENILLQARAEALDSQKNTDELYKEALAAMKSYQGQDPDEDL